MRPYFRKPKGGGGAGKEVEVKERGREGRREGEEERRGERWQRGRQGDAKALRQPDAAEAQLWSAEIAEVPPYLVYAGLRAEPRASCFVPHSANFLKAPEILMCGQCLEARLQAVRLKDTLILLLCFACL